MRSVVDSEWLELAHKLPPKAVGNAVVIAGDSFAIDDAGARAQPGERINDRREATSEFIARMALELHLRASLAGNDAGSRRA
jgi:hypothetical protein